MSCAFEDCGNPDCPVCSTARKPQRFTRLVEASDLRDDARALNGTKPRQVRDPRFTKRKRKMLTP